MLLSLPLLESVQEVTYICILKKKKKKYIYIYIYIYMSRSWSQMKRHYNVVSNKCHPPTSPNTVLATILVTDETSFTMRWATGVILQHHQILHLPGKKHVMIEGMIDPCAWGHHRSLHVCLVFACTRASVTKSFTWRRSERVKSRRSERANSRRSERCTSPFSILYPTPKLAEDDMRPRTIAFFIQQLSWQVLALAGQEAPNHIVQSLIELLPQVPGFNRNHSLAKNF